MVDRQFRYAVQRARTIQRDGRLGAWGTRRDGGSGPGPGSERGQAKEVQRAGEIGQRGGQIVAMFVQCLTGRAQAGHNALSSCA